MIQECTRGKGTGFLNTRLLASIHPSAVIDIDECEPVPLTYLAVPFPFRFGVVSLLHEVFSYRYS
jgi:hypothetical protein